MLCSALCSTRSLQQIDIGISLSQRRLLEHFTSCPFEQTRVAEEPLKFSSVLLSLGAFIVG